jgi:hypothetical protein
LKAAGRGRQPDAQNQLGVRQTGVALQLGEDRRVVAVERGAVGCGEKTSAARAPTL